MIDVARVNRIEAAYRVEAEACQKALGEDDFVELDLINQRAQSLLALCAARGWHLDTGVLECAGKSVENGGRIHERAGP